MAKTDGSLYQKQAARIMGWIQCGKLEESNNKKGILITASLIYAEKAYRDGYQVLIADQNGLRKFDGINVISEPIYDNSSEKNWYNPIISHGITPRLISEGGQAKIFLESDNDRIIKLYKLPKTINQDRIKLLVKEGKYTSIINQWVVFPDDTLVQDDKTVGVSSRYIEGMRLSEAVYESQYNSVIQKLLKEMPYILVELSVRDIVLSDLHKDNILVNRHQFAIIDVDSAQKGQYLSSVWRGSTALPSLVRDAENRVINTHFRTMEEDLFAFYIIIFELYLGLNPLSVQNNDPNFCNSEFVFLNPSKAPLEAQKAWADLSIEQRNFFYRSFVYFDIPALSEYQRIFVN